MAITDEQFARWKDFAIRMARTCFKRRRSPSGKEIEANVLHFFDCLDPEDKLSIVDWDHSEPYPKGSKYYRRAYRCPCWHCSKRGNTKADCPYSCEDGKIYDYANTQYVCDHIAELSEAWNPYYWNDLSESHWDKRDEQFVGPVRCCIRAGLDMAVSPSMGVLGFTAGDLRRMYPEGVPDWLTGGPDERWATHELTHVVPAVGFVATEPKLDGTFAAIPDNTAVWL